MVPRERRQAQGRARQVRGLRFEWDSTARPPTDSTGNTGSGRMVWNGLPDDDWTQSAAGRALSCT